MAVLSIEELYERYIKPLTPAERLRLLAMTAHDLAQTSLLPENSGAGLAAGLARFIGAAQGSFATPAEADAFILREREAWHS
ncbi:MAG TPA: hypothetical protein VFB38_20195 [Chthonomonadaceae bacterium]|nr:hypothetical protein [Chthonomonadaceae bacterium]